MNNKSAVPVATSAPVVPAEEEEKDAETVQPVAGVKSTQAAHTSIKVHNPPGGRSQISFG